MCAFAPGKMCRFICANRCDDLIRVQTLRNGVYILPARQAYVPITTSNITQPNVMPKKSTNFHIKNGPFLGGPQDLVQTNIQKSALNFWRIVFEMNPLVINIDLKFMNSLDLIVTDKRFEMFLFSCYSSRLRFAFTFNRSIWIDSAYVHCARLFMPIFNIRLNAS